MALTPACSSVRADAPAGIAGPTLEMPGLLQEEDRPPCTGTWIHAYNGPYPDMDPFTKWAYADPGVVGNDPYAVTWSVGPNILDSGWASAFRYTGPKQVPGPSGYLRGASGLHVLQARYLRQCARITVCIPNEDGTGCDQ